MEVFWLLSRLRRHIILFGITDSTGSTGNTCKNITRTWCIVNQKSRSICFIRCRIHLVSSIMTYGLFASYNDDMCLLIRRLLFVVKMVIHVINYLTTSSKAMPTRLERTLTIHFSSFGSFLVFGSVLSGIVVSSFEVPS